MYDFAIIFPGNSQGIFSANQLRTVLKEMSIMEASRAWGQNPDQDPLTADPIRVSTTSFGGNFDEIMTQTLKSAHTVLVICADLRWSEIRRIIAERAIAPDKVLPIRAAECSAPEGLSAVCIQIRPSEICELAGVAYLKRFRAT